MLECVVNISEGCDADLLSELRTSVEGALLDVHVDGSHNRSVFTVSGADVRDAVWALTSKAIRLIDIKNHTGVHPRFGVVDVVPFVPLPGTASEMPDAIKARDDFARRLANELDVPAFLYGRERSLPLVRKTAFVSLAPDMGPPRPHQTAGACAVGARGVLVAYNLWLSTADAGAARRIASEIRAPQLRTLGLDTAGHPQVSCNLVEPLELGPEIAYDLVSSRAHVLRAELVGLLPEAALHNVPKSRWQRLDLAEEKTIEARLSAIGASG